MLRAKLWILVKKELTNLAALLYARENGAASVFSLRGVGRMEPGQGQLDFIYQGAYLLYAKQRATWLMTRS